MSITAGGDFSWTPSETQGGLTPSVTITVSDGTVTDSETVTITVADINEAPVLGSIGDRSVDELSTLAFTATATDSDLPADTLTFSLDPASVAAGMSIDANTGAFSWTPTEGQDGLTPPVTVTVTDSGSGNLIDSETFSITVGEVNVAPTVTSSAVTTATEDAAYSYTITTSDVDGNALTITAPTLPDWLTLVDNGDGTATLSGTPTNAEVGDQSVVLEVSDGALTDTQNFTLNVSGATIDPPVDDVDPDDVVFLTTNPDIIENPEPDDGLDPGVEDPTKEEPKKNPVIEDEQAPSVAEHLILQGSNDADDQLVYMQDPEIKENAEIIYLTDENDTDTQSEGRKEDRSYIFFKKDLYKDIRYTATAANRPIPEGEDNFSILDFDSDDVNRVDVNGDYDLLRQEIDESFNSELKSQAVKAKIVTITAATFGVGFVSYLPH